MRRFRIGLLAASSFAALSFAYQDTQLRGEIAAIYAAQASSDASQWGTGRVLGVGSEGCAGTVTARCNVVQNAIDVLLSPSTAWWVFEPWNNTCMPADIAGDSLRDHFNQPFQNVDTPQALEAYAEEKGLLGSYDAVPFGKNFLMVPDVVTNIGRSAYDTDVLYFPVDDDQSLESGAALCQQFKEFLQDQGPSVFSYWYN
jgi:hypothetical protein